MNKHALAAAALLILMTACAGPTQTPQATTSSATPTTRPPQPTACTTNELAISLGPKTGTGKVSVPIIFTNHTNGTCTMAGYPGVAYVAGDHHQIGDPAGGSSGALPTVTLGPGQSASAMLDQADVATFDPAQCGPTPAWGLRIAPPHSTDDVYIPEQNAMACAKHTGTERLWLFHLTVTPVRTGTGTS